MKKKTKKQAYAELESYVSRKQEQLAAAFNRLNGAELTAERNRLYALIGIAFLEYKDGFPVPDTRKKKVGKWALGDTVRPYYLESNGKKVHLGRGPAGIVEFTQKGWALLYWPHNNSWSEGEVEHFEATKERVVIPGFSK